MLIWLFYHYFFIQSTFCLHKETSEIEPNSSVIAIGLSDIINGLQQSSLSILTSYKYENIMMMNEFLYEIHKRNIKTSIFSEIEEYFKYIEETTKGAIETSSLIFAEPSSMIEDIHDRNVAHRINTFIFYCGATEPPNSRKFKFSEPLRAVIITMPRAGVFKVYYNQAIPSGKSNLRLVNWYDAENLGLHQIPLLPSASKVYRNFNGRVFYVPVIHSPPWHFVSYNDDRNDNETADDYALDSSLKVIGGRDHHLLQILAAKMDFQYIYIDPPERTQGAANSSEENANFTGGLGMIQNKQADFLFGDVTLSLERRRAAEFSFFTLADSGAFATHAPKRLNEALALIRPFKNNVWPILILTVVLSGPAFYLVIAIPYFWRRTEEEIHEGNSLIHRKYLNEITLMKKKNNFSNKCIDRRQVLPEKLLERCIWFSLTLFLKQCIIIVIILCLKIMGLTSKELYNGSRARFLMIVYWLAATYVLADVYSAQLTSQFARPAREGPINTLTKLEYALRHQGYELFVERESSSLFMLENSTSTFRRLYRLMLDQADPNKQTNSFLISSVEEGIHMVLSSSNKIILGGRETLYFNMKRYSLKNFQMSYKLYTRYSAVAVQIGCPFLEILNDMLMHLFEGGILEKITNTEYEKMSTFESKNENSNFKTEDIGQIDKIQQHTTELDIQPINLRMLQGTFIILLIGYTLAGLVFILELNFANGKIQKYFAVLRVINVKLKSNMSKLWICMKINITTALNELLN